jgi:class 3 adenylate cyclase
VLLKLTSSRYAHPLARHDTSLRFTDTTIAFMDIVGFTAYSSTRDPSQVFTLLETVFHSFDSVAKQRRVFKVRMSLLSATAPRVVQ